ncbi:MAG: PilZ domain-containing protein [Candidatus Omnitrophota bacterium]
MLERRNLARSQVNKCAILKLANNGGEKSSAWIKRDKSPDLLCQILDINHAGAQILLNAKLPSDSALKMKLQIGEDSEIDAEVWVTWHKAINGSNHYGLYFSEIKDIDKEKINKLISDIHSHNYAGYQPSDNNETQEAKGGEAMDDYRIFERFKREFSARYIGLDGKECTAQTIDVSAKGLGLSTNQRLDSQTPLEIWLDVPGSTDPLYTRGQVVWSRTSGTKGWHSGIELERADLMGISRLLRA